jgi:hypothetical protein
MNESVNDTTNSSPDTTLYSILILQILLLVERVFQNALKRIKHMRCSNCCSIDAFGASNDSPPIRRKAIPAEPEAPKPSNESKEETLSQSQE